MFTINIKGKSNPRYPKLVKLEIIFFKTNYSRAAKVLNISDPIEGWNNESQSFKTNYHNATTKNKMLFDINSQYQKVAEEWEYEGRIWSPVELSHCFDEAKARQTEVKALSVLQMIDNLVEYFSTKEREKNGVVITSVVNAKAYKEIKTSLSRFTQEEYGKAFSTFYFKDITEKFLLDFTLHTKKQGIKNGNKGGLVTKLRRFGGRFVITHCNRLRLQCVSFVD